MWKVQVGKEKKMAHRQGEQKKKNMERLVKRTRTCCYCDSLLEDVL